MKTTKTMLLGLLFFMTILNGSLMAKITGKVTDTSNVALPGASVTVQETKASASTNFDGTFEIEAEIGQHLVFTFMGMISKTIEIKNYKPIVVALADEAKSLQEVVVIGYGSQKNGVLRGLFKGKREAQVSSVPATISYNDYSKPKRRKNTNSELDKKTDSVTTSGHYPKKCVSLKI